MRPLLLSILFLVFVTQLWGQDIPQDRVTRWTDAGLKQEIIFEKTVDISDYEELKTATGSYHEAFQQCLNKLGESGGVINFGEGEYFFDTPLNIPSNIVVQGVSAEKTVFKFNLQSNSHCIQFKGGTSGKWINLGFALKRGQSEITGLNEFSKGDIIFIRYRDKSKLKNDWAYNHFGQILTIENKNNDVIQLDHPIRMDMENATLIDVIKLQPVVNSGIQGVKIIRTDRTSSKTSNIYFKYAANCFVSGVNSEKTNYAHVELSHSTHVEIVGSYFHHAHSYGSGGKGYGVMAHFSSGDCLIESNVFEHLRHSMILQAGANGNVFGYNYSIDPYWEQGFFPSSSAGDIVLHGNYPYLNLFEGNIAQNLVIDGSHGINGHYNTFFRNRLEYVGITSIGYPFTHSQNFVANEVTAEGLLTGMFVIVGADHFSSYNLVRKEVLPSNSKAPEKLSYYGVIQIENQVIGSLSNYNSIGNDAKARYNSGELTNEYPCYRMKVIVQQSEIKKEKKSFWKKLKFWGRN